MVAPRTNAPSHTHTTQILGMRARTHTHNTHPAMLVLHSWLNLLGVHGGRGEATEEDTHFVIFLHRYM
jgi:hypothetical protein